MVNRLRKLILAFAACLGCSTSSTIFAMVMPNARGRRVLPSMAPSPHYLPYDSAYAALEAYHKIHGDLAIPGNFVVPSSSTDEYPVEWHGVKLSHYIYNMKWWQKHIAQNKDRSKERVAQLNKLGFVWERLQPQWNIFIESLAIYRDKYGDVLVPSSFVVPRDEQWHKACWDLPLGSIVQRLRTRHDFLMGDNAILRKAQLDGLGFIWDTQEYNFDRLCRALRHFDRLQSSSAGEQRFIRVPSKFVVPTGEENGWPPESWGYRLGAKGMAVRQKQLYIKGHPERKQILEDIGFRWGNATLGWKNVVHAAAIYSQMHCRELNVPFTFVVPAPPRDDPQCADNWPWPERLWGLRLGQRLKDVRLKGAYLKVRWCNIIPPTLLMISVFRPYPLPTYLMITT